jgi:cytochrome c oxidase assembly protein subunit 15
MNNKSTKPVVTWLYGCAALVFIMVIVGAITRLTESGLSMVEWRPLIGAIPPLNDTEWMRTFDLYKQTPEFIKENYWMELADFKKIFFWEWFHRLLGRLIGLAYGLPLLIFWVKGMIPKNFKLPLLGLLFLGAAQGFMGWYMVKSGLVDMPAVSHYRLAAHLSLAFLIFALLIWNALAITAPDKNTNTDKPLKFHLWGCVFALIFTIIWGAFVAGLDAGLIYTDSFPKMGKTFVPFEMWLYQPFFVNFFENHAAVQFTHRWLAMFTGLVILSFWAHAAYKKRASWPVHALGIMILIQIALGIATLLSQVHLHVAVTHQAGALILLGLLTINLRRL